MGQESSQPSPLPPPPPENPRSEHSLISHFPHGPAFKDATRRLHSPEELSSLLLGCYEQLGNIPEILDALIQASQGEDHPLVAALSQEFSDYATFASRRLGSISHERTFQHIIFSHGIERSKQKHFCPVTVAEIIGLFQCGLSPKSAEMQRPTIIATKKKIKGMVPSSAFTPPSPFFRVNQPGQVEPIIGRYVVTHGLASNGTQLFVLCANGHLLMYSLMNAGTLFPAKTLTLTALSTSRASLIATRTTLTIVSHSSQYQFQISDFMKNTINARKTQVGTPAIFHCADGITQVTVDAEQVASVSIGEQLIRKVKLQASPCTQLHPRWPVLFPAFDYDLVPVETNGAYLAIVLRLDEATVVFRVFSLFTGRHIVDEVIPCRDVIFGVTFDAVNRCHWVATWLEDNRLGIRKYTFRGSLDPAILEFVERPLVKKPKELMALARRMNDVLKHYAGSQAFPECYLVCDENEFDTLVRQAILWGQQFPEVGVLQVFVVLIVMNLPKLSSQKSAMLFELVKLLPLNLATFLLFSSIQFDQVEFSDQVLSTMHSLLKQASP
jgi:hypothetical protein